MTNVKFTENAYCKMVLHATKYPHCSVNGVLLSKTSPLNNNKEIEFVDAVPLFHICLNLTPMVEIALMQIDEYASKKGLTISGYYVAPENVREDSFDKLYNRISDKIASNCTNSYVVIVNTTSTSIQKGRRALKVAQYADGTYRQCEDLSVSDDAINICLSALNGSLYNNLVDFDNHLDNIRLDWTNTTLNKEIQSLL
nr:ER membrane protein complex subunit 8/9 homolog [Leptinotarsa decemlineata]